MKITDYITDVIFIPDDAISIRTSKSKAIKYILSNAHNLNDFHSDRIKELYDALLLREKLGSTAIGRGIAIPHTVISNFEEIRLLIGISEQGVDFESLDGNPAHLFFLLIAPENTLGTHLKLLARISRILNLDDLKKGWQMRKVRSKL